MNTLVANFENLPGTAMEFHFQKSLYLICLAYVFEIVFITEHSLRSFTKFEDLFNLNKRQSMRWNAKCLS